MPYTLHHVLACGCLSVAIFGNIACAPKSIPPMTVEELMDDRVTLDGVLMKCNQHLANPRTDSDCHNARVAVERLARAADPAEQAKHNAEFERKREQRRLAQEKMRQDQQANGKVDGYTLPVVPLEPAAASGGPETVQPKP